MGITMLTICIAMLGFMSSGLVESRGVMRREAESFQNLKTRICGGLNGLGEDAYRSHCVVYFTKRLGVVSLDHVEILANHCLRIAKQCCDVGAADNCLLTELEAVPEQICTHLPEAKDVPLVGRCCALSGAERYVCFDQSGGDGAWTHALPVTSPAEYDSSTVCTLHATANGRLYDTLLWEFSRRYPSASDSHLIALANEFITALTTCCLVEQEHEPCLLALREDFKHKLIEASQRSQNLCKALKALGKEKFEDRMIVKFTQRAPGAPFDLIHKLAHRFEVLAEKCCELGHADRCLVEERYTVDDELCSEQSFIATAPRLFRCCSLSGGSRAHCLETAPLPETSDQAPSATPTLPLSEQCTMWTEKAAEFHNRVVWQIAHRYPTAGVGQVEALAKHYLEHLTTCCASEDKDACMATEVAEFKSQLEKVHAKSEWWCKMSQLLGTDRFNLLLIVKYSQRVPQATFEQVEEVSHHFALITRKCCSQRNDGSCFLEEHHALHDELCRDEVWLSGLPEVSRCCALDGRERIVCFNEVSTHGNVTVDEHPELCSSSLCSKYNDLGFQFKQRVAYEFGRRFPKAAMGQMRDLISKYLSMVQRCCGAISDFRMDVHEAELRAHRLCVDAHQLGEEKLADRIMIGLAQRISDASFLNVSSAALHFAQSVTKCCDADHEKTCFMEQEFALEDQVCSDTEALSHMASVARCCQLHPYDRSVCFRSLRSTSTSTSASTPGVVKVDNSLPGHEEECRAVKSGSHSLVDRVMFEFARRHPRASVSQIESLARLYTQLAQHCCSLADAEQEACLNSARSQARNKALMALRRSEIICNTLSAIGKEKFEDRIVIDISQKAADASFEQILEISERMARGLARCCEQGQNVGCLMDHRHALHEAICSTPSGSLPQSVAGCCNSPATTTATSATTDNALENRDRCFDNLQANVTLSHSPFYSDAKLCSMRLRMPHRFLERFLWEFGRRHPQAALSQVEELAERFAKMADSCCGKVDSASCFTQQRHAIHMEIRHAYAEVQHICGSLHSRGEDTFTQREVTLLSQKAPNASFEKVSQLARHFLSLARKCCAPDHAAGCFLEERYAIHDELCHDDEVVEQVGGLAACCALSGSARAKCLEQLPRAEQTGQREMPHFDEQKICVLKNENPEMLMEKILYEFGRRHPDSAVSEVKHFAQKFSHSVTECCASDKTHDCFVEKRAAIEKVIKDEEAKGQATCQHMKTEGINHFEQLVMVNYAKAARSLSMENVVEFAHRFARDAHQCCEHDTHCLLDESLHLHAEMCGDHSYITAHPGAAKCCKSDVSEQGACFKNHEDTHRAEELLTAPAGPEPPSAERVCLRYRQFPEKFVNLALYEFAHRLSSLESSVLRTKALAYADFTDDCCRAVDKTACFTEKLKATQTS